MKYFITGSTGFIGSALANHLAEQGHQVRVLVRSKEKAKLLNEKNITLFLGTLGDRKILKDAISGVDGIFHLAAFAQPFAYDKTTYNKINVAGTKIIFDLAKEFHIRRVVFTSTAGTFGPSKEYPVDENTIRKIDFLNEYESTKFMAEKLAKDYVISGLDVVTVHPTRVYGPGVLSKSNAVTLMIKKYNQGLWRIIPGNGKRQGNYAFIEDVVNGHILAMNKGEKGAQYILGGENASYIDFFNQLKVAANKKYLLIKIPIILLKTFAAIQMQLALLFGKKPLLPPKWVKKYMYDWEVSSKKAQHEIDYKITPLSEGFTKTLEWLKMKKNETR
jgi:farnesol dehydrogenase